MNFIICFFFRPSQEGRPPSPTGSQGPGPATPGSQDSLPSTPYQVKSRTKSIFFWLIMSFSPGDSCLLRRERCPGVSGHRCWSCWGTWRPSEAPGISSSTSSSSAWIPNLVNIFLNYISWRPKGLLGPKLEPSLLPVLGRPLQVEAGSTRSWRLGRAL